MYNKFRRPRVWSNEELKKFAHLFKGSIINVSAETDKDKTGNSYRQYFFNADTYSISNYQTNEPSWENEIYLDLEKHVPVELQGKFDVVFSHTTLEHVFECRAAFKSLCTLSKDIVIAVVPYLQQVHGISYKDYWRFTPWTMQKMYAENGLHLQYCSSNGADKASIYLFCIGYRDRNKWDNAIPNRFDLRLSQDKDLYADNCQNVIGGNVID